MDALILHRLQFAFTITFHYLFPQLTMGLALLIVVMKWLGLREEGGAYNDAARFCARIFGINFVLGVTGIPMEFEFGTNWSRFAELTGGIIGQPLAMEGVFSFFLESAFLGLFLFGERSLSKIGHWWAAFLVFLGSWISGFAGLIASVLQVFPTGDLHGRYMARHQPATVAGMEALFKSEKGAPLILIGQPNVATQD